MFSAQVLLGGRIPSKIKKVQHPHKVDAVLLARPEGWRYGKTVPVCAGSPQVGARRAPLREKQATGLFFSAQTLSGFESLRTKKTALTKSESCFFGPPGGIRTPQKKRKNAGFITFFDFCVAFRVAYCQKIHLRDLLLCLLHRKRCIDRHDAAPIPTTILPVP